VIIRPSLPGRFVSLDKFFPADESKNTGLMNEKWMRLQDELAGLSSHSVHLVSQNSTHAIAREKPEYVVTAIKTASHLGVAADGTRKENGQLGVLGRRFP
jgi:hypothetical protein